MSQRFFSCARSHTNNFIFCLVIPAPCSLNLGLKHCFLTPTFSLTWVHLPLNFMVTFMFYLHTQIKSILGQGGREKGVGGCLVHGQTTCNVPGSVSDLQVDNLRPSPALYLLFDLYIAFHPPRASQGGSQSLSLSKSLDSPNQSGKRRQKMAAPLYSVSNNLKQLL